jgi:hypothetical protein
MKIALAMEFCAMADPIKTFIYAAVAIAATGLIAILGELAGWF